jgi:hypothetical protein
VVGFDGQGGSDRSTIWNDGNTSGWTYQDLSGSVLVDRNDGLASNDPNHIFYQLTALNTETTAVRGGSAADTFSINAATTQPFTVVGQGGLDVVSIASGMVLFDASDDLQSLTISGGAAQMVANGNNCLAIKQLFIGSGAQFDLTNNDMILDYTGTSKLASIAAMIASARSGGTWTGSGLTSTTAKNNPKHNTTLAAVEATEYKQVSGSAIFDGTSVDNDAVLVKYTYYGDTDLNGSVTFSDYSRLDSTFQTQTKPGTVIDWFHGDFNYDGVIGFSDYSLIDNAFQTQSGTLGRVPQSPELPDLPATPGVRLGRVG